MIRLWSKSLPLLGGVELAGTARENSAVPVLPCLRLKRTQEDARKYSRGVPSRACSQRCSFPARTILQEAESNHARLNSSFYSSNSSGPGNSRRAAGGNSQSVSICDVSACKSPKPRVDEVQPQPHVAEIYTNAVGTNVSQVSSAKLLLAEHGPGRKSHHSVAINSAASVLRSWYVRVRGVFTYMWACTTLMLRFQLYADWGTVVLPCKELDTTLILSRIVLVLTHVLQATYGVASRYRGAGSTNFVLYCSVVHNMFQHAYLPHFFCSCRRLSACLPNDIGCRCLVNSASREPCPALLPRGTYAPVTPRISYVLLCIIRHLVNESVFTAPPLSFRERNQT